MFVKEKVKIKSKLENFDGEISLSVDIRGMFFDFVCISMHFIDETRSLKQWVIKSCSLGRAAY